MKFLGRAAILLLSSLFLISSAPADANKAGPSGKATDSTTAAATNDSAANPAPTNSNDAAPQPVATAAVTTPANNGATPAPKPAPKPSSSARQDGDEQPPKWNPMPALDGNPGLFTLETGDILPKGGFDLAVSVNKFSRMPGNVTVLQVAPSIGFGINRWFSIFAETLPEVHLHVGQPQQLSLNQSPATNPRFRNTIYLSELPGFGDPPAYVEDYPFASHSGGGYGELDLGFKIGVLSEKRGNWASLSIRNDFFIPTRTGLNTSLAHQVQNGNFSYGLGLEASKSVLHRSIIATINWSYRFMRDQSFNVPGGTPTVQVLDIADQMQAGFGLLMFPEKRFNIITEYSGLIYMRQGLPNTTLGPRDPVDNVTGLRIYLSKYVALDAGYRYSMNLNNHLDRNGFIAKLGISRWPTKPREPDNLTSSCSVDRPSVMEGSNDLVQASATATDAWGHPLTYTWTATGGKMNGTGPYARWDSAGVAPGSYSLTAHVDDGAGMSSSCSATVNVQPKPAPAAPTMSCSADRSTVLAGERPQITANVNDPSGTALTYKWQSNGGQILGTGSTIQLDTSGLSPGAYAVTGRVENAAGGAADCSTPINVQAPPPPPQASKINECSFVPASAVVNNVCKRVLDDLAVRLQTEPKAKAVLVGFADPKEPGASKLASRRAENARKYLGEKKGMDASRVDVRSAPGTEAEARQNRHVDVVWVPDGASY
jgi:outer membrane protein OmpA-like peptidoglycan-associated protein